MAYLLAQPVTRAEVFTGKYLGLALSLLASLALGFGIAGVVLALNGGAGSPTAYVSLTGQTFLLSLTMLSVGFLISALTKRAGVAIGIGLFLWLAFVFLGDLGLMGTAITMRLPIDQLLWLSLANPLQTFKMAAILDINATLDLLGPAGIYAMQEYGAQLRFLFLAIMAAWIALPGGGGVSAVQPPRGFVEHYTEGAEGAQELREFVLWAQRAIHRLSADDADFRRVGLHSSAKICVICGYCCICRRKRKECVG
ncbi:MAG: ABC transporter permease [Tetrasphaera sp.]